MGRLNKVGLDYHPLYVDIDNNVKIRYLISECGIFAELVLIHLWRMIYRDKGYYCEFNDDVAILLSDDLRGKFSPTEIKNVVKICVRRNLFDARIFEEYKILTSRRIQEVYITVTPERNILRIDPKYWISEIPRSTKSRKIVLIGRESIDLNENTTDLYNNTVDFSTKEGKEARKQGKEANYSASQIARFSPDYLKLPLEERKETFRGAVASYSNTYDAKCLEKFYNVWAEHNTGGNWMKWELEKVWNLEDRLRRWGDGWLETERKKEFEGQKKSRMQHNMDAATEVLRDLMNEQK